MSITTPKQAPIRLNEESYQNLRKEILRRDCWRCQLCGSMTNLEVHHKEFRSLSGQDIEQNLITLCSACHSRVHEVRISMTSDQFTNVPQGTVPARAGAFHGKPQRPQNL